MPKPSKCQKEKRLSIKDLFKSDPSLIFEVRQGLERECLRVNENGIASKKNHPASIGHKLTHKFITTDYAENLLEFITGVHSSTDDLLNELYAVHSATAKVLEGEFFWPSSMPSILPTDAEVPLAYFGESNVGRLKHYTEGGWV